MLGKDGFYFMKIFSSKFYLVCGLEVHPGLGAFDSAAKAEDKMNFIKERTETQLKMERKTEYKGWRAVSGRMILKMRVPYKIMQA